jgi:hypothetical protein
MPADIRRSMRAAANTVVTAILLLNLAACGHATSATSSPAIAATASAAPAASMAESPAPDPGLTKVQTDDARAAIAAITADGGTVSATGADGTTYRLAIPAGALPGTTTISLYPVTGLAGLPTGASLGAGVQFLPDGLQLLAPATLTIQLAPGAAEAKTGLAWRGDAVGIHAAPALVHSRTITMQVLHFSGDGVGEIPLEPIGRCTTNDELEQQLANDLVSSTDPTIFKALLRQCYVKYVAPELEADTEVATNGGEPSAWENGYVAYTSWLNALDMVRVALGDPGFTVSPELDQSRIPAAAFLRAWYRYWNALCVGSKDLEWHTPVKFARDAMLWTRQPAVTWNLSTSANQLDLQTLLDQLCVKVVIDPSRNFSATGTGETGRLSVKAGFAIANGPLQTPAGAVSVRASLSGASAAVGEGPIDAAGMFATDVDWPETMDPIQIDLVATLIDTEPFDAGPIESIEVPTDIQRVDLLVKDAEQLSFTFDTDLEGWVRDTAGLKGSVNWGTVYWLPKAGGSVQLDGTGGPSQPNAWISKVIILPTNAATLAWDVSAHNRLDADTHFRIRIVDGTTSTTLEDERLSHTGPDGALSFTTQSADISAWAGKVVTIFFEQDDNGINGHFPGGDEQVHVDNVRITRR